MPHAWRTCVARSVYRDTPCEDHTSGDTFTLSWELYERYPGEFCERRPQTGIPSAPTIFPQMTGKVITVRPALDSGTGSIAPLCRHRADLRTCTFDSCNGSKGQRTCKIVAGASLAGTIISPKVVT
jgi:hypothetical protein